MSPGWKLALFIVAACLAFLEALRSEWDHRGNRVPHLGWLAFTTFVIVFAWDVAAVR